MPSSPSSPDKAQPLANDDGGDGDSTLAVVESTENSNSKKRKEDPPQHDDDNDDNSQQKERGAQLPQAADQAAATAAVSTAATAAVVTAATAAVSTAATAAVVTATVLPRPIKRARTAYFIFTDEKRSEIQSQHPGEGVAVVSRVLGQMWSSMNATDKEKYQLQAAEERERVTKELQAMNESNAMDPNYANAMNNTAAAAAAAGAGGGDILSLVLPVARIRKICKLDPDVKGLSREALVLITKCAELVTSKLALESLRVAQLQNRRKLLPDDVAQVCQTREQFLFLKDDVKDLVQEQRKQHLQHRAAAHHASSGSGSNKGHHAPSKAQEAAAANTKPLTAYFGGSGGSTTTNSTKE